LLAAAALSLEAGAVACSKQSPAHTVALIELYTSEGCNSCPPADRWLSRLRQELPAERVVALSLHVDYWDRLGWPDRFASPAYTERQQMLARAGATIVYTPGVFLNLKEWRAWRSPSGLRSALERINSRPAGADIRLELSQPAPGQLAVKADVKSKGGRQPQAYLALHESDLSTEVRAGENRGATLRHDQVVREWVGPLPVGPGAAEVTRTFVLGKDWKPANLGVAAIVIDAGGRELLQATSLQVCTG
jgi:hypothetical protein